MPKTNENHRTVTIQQCPGCKEEACEVCLLAHEQADDTADGVLLDSYDNVFGKESKTPYPCILL